MIESLNLVIVIYVNVVSKRVLQTCHLVMVLWQNHGFFLEKKHMSALLAPGALGAAPGPGTSTIKGKIDAHRDPICFLFSGRVDKSTYC